jgi:hypothetical protein
MAEEIDTQKPDSEAVEPASAGSALDALDYAIYICNTRAGSLRHVAYNAACHDIICFLEAAKGRLLDGGELHDYAVTQNV